MRMIRKLAAVVVAAIFLAPTIACATQTGECGGVKELPCPIGDGGVAPREDGIDHAWPEPAPEDPAPAQTDSAGKKTLPTAIPPGAPVNPQPSKTKQARRVELHMKRTEQSGATVEIEWAINGQHMLPIPAYAQGGWRRVEWLNPGTTVHLWISRNPGNKATIRCWITINGKIPSAANRPDGVPMFAAEGHARSPFDCYVSAWIT
jgi:hypothetical protein